MAFEDQIVKYTQTVAELDAVDTTTLSDGQQASVENDGIYVLDKTADEWTQTTLKAPYVLSSYRGLKISEFLTSNDFEADQKVPLSIAMEALRNGGRYFELDLEGRRLGIDGVLDFGSIWSKDSSLGIRTIKNGWLSAVTDTSGERTEFTRLVTTEIGSNKITFPPNSPIEMGMYITGPGVPRESYVVRVDKVAGSAILNTRAWRSLTEATHRFINFQYMFDFRNVTSLLNFQFKDIIFDGAGGISLFNGPKGVEDPVGTGGGGTLSFSRCVFSKPADRGITFWSSGGANLQIDNCQGTSNDAGKPPAERTSVFCTVSSNDAKFRGNYIWQYGHTLVLHGSGNVIVGNHFWQGKGQKEGSTDDGTRTASIILTSANNKTNIVGNYIDNSWIELANDNTVNLNWPLGGGVTITGNQFTTVSKIGTYGFIALAPYKPDTSCARISVVGNVFKNVDGGAYGAVVPMERPDVILVPTGSEGTIDRNKVSQIYWRSNSYYMVDKNTASEVTVEKQIPAGEETSMVGFSFLRQLPWNFYPRSVLSSSVYSAKTTAGVASPTSVMFDGNLGSTIIINMRLAEPRSGRFGITVSCNAALEQ